MHSFLRPSLGEVGWVLGDEVVQSTSDHTMHATRTLATYFCCLHVQYRYSICMFINLCHTCPGFKALKSLKLCIETQLERQIRIATRARQEIVRLFTRH